VIDGRIVAWTERRRSTRVENGFLTYRESARLVVRSLATGRIRTTATRPYAMLPLIVGHKLYVTGNKKLWRVKL